MLWIVCCVKLFIIVHYWVQTVFQGHTRFADKSAQLATEASVWQVEEMIWTQRWLKIDSFNRMVTWFSLQHCRIFLKSRKVCSQWGTRELTDQHNMDRTGLACCISVYKQKKAGLPGLLLGTNYGFTTTNPNKEYFKAMETSFSNLHQENQGSGTSSKGYA